MASGWWRIRNALRKLRLISFGNNGERNWGSIPQLGWAVVFVFCGNTEKQVEKPLGPTSTYGRDLRGTERIQITGRVMRANLVNGTFVPLPRRLPAATVKFALLLAAVVTIVATTTRASAIVVTITSISVLGHHRAVNHCHLGLCAVLRTHHHWNHREILRQ